MRNVIRIALKSNFFPKNRPAAGNSVTCLSCTNFLATFPKFHGKEKFLICGSGPSFLHSKSRLRAKSDAQLLIFILSPIKSPSFQGLLMTSLHDLRVSSPPNLKSRLRLRIKPCAICIPDTSRCILVLLAHLHERLFTTMQRCKATKYQCWDYCHFHESQVRSASP